MSDLFETLWGAPMRRRGWVEFDARLGLVRYLGVQHGDTHLLGANDVPGLGLVLITREVPGKHWASRGSYRSHPAQVQAILLDSEPSERLRWRYIDLGSTDLGKNDEGRAESSAQRIARLGIDCFRS